MRLYSYFPVAALLSVSCTPIALPVQARDGAVHMDGGVSRDGDVSPDRHILDANVDDAGVLDTGSVDSGPTLKTLDITIGGNGAGRISSPGGEVDCDASCSTQFTEPLSLTLVAVPASGSRFTGWMEACSGTRASCSLRVDQDLVVGATFEQVQCEPEDPTATTVIGLYGQSLAVGTNGNPALTTTEPFPVDVFVLNAALDRLCSAREGGPCGPWANVETSRTAIARTWRSLRGEGKFVINNAAVAGLSIAALAKGTAPYARLIDQFRESAALAPSVSGGAASIVRAVAFVHGPSDEPNSGYEAALRQLVADVNADTIAITGQQTPIHFFIDQTSSWANAPNVALDQLSACRSDPLIHCVGPQYYLDYSDDHVHLRNTGYRENGERIGSAMYRAIDECLDVDAPYALGAQAVGDRIRVAYHVPEPPLVFDTSRCPEYPSRGFELATDTLQSVTIEDVQVVEPDVLELRTSEPLAEDTFTLRYAYSGAPLGGGDCRRMGDGAPGGNLKDSAAFTWPKTADTAAWALTHQVAVTGGQPPPPATAPGYFSVSASDAHVLVPHAQSLVTTAELSVSFWVRIPAFVHNRVLLEKGREWSIRTFDNGQIRELTLFADGFSSGSRSTFGVAGIDIGDGDWHHVAVTYSASGNRVTWYIDCRLAGERTSAPAIPAGTANFTLGHPQFAVSADYADVAIYSAALPPPEVFALCRAPIDLCGPGCATSAVTTALPVSWWRPVRADDFEVPFGVADHGTAANAGTALNNVAHLCGWPTGAPCSGGAPDAGVLDATVDAGSSDAGAPDTGAPDAGTVAADAGAADSGAVDAGMPSVSSLELDGVGDYVDIGTFSTLNTVPLATVGGWVFNTGATDVNGYLFNRYDSNQRQFGLFTRGANLRVYLAETLGSVAQCETTDGRITPNTWHHVAAVFDGIASGSNRLAIYIDGIASPTTCLGTLPPTMTTPTAGSARFGCVSDSAQSCFGPGRLSTWGVWPLALTATQVQEVVAVRTAITTLVGTPAPAHRWSFSGDALDLGSNVTTFNGTLAGDATYGNFAP